MELKQFIKLQGRGSIYFLVFGAAILILIVIGIYSSKKFSEIKNREIKALCYEIEEQKVVFPVYSNLLDKMPVIGPEVLAFPAKTRLSEDKIEEIPMRFAEIAQKCKLEAVSIIPDVMSLDRDSGRLLVDVFVKGDFFNFRKFLIEIGRVPYLEHIEKVHIQRTMEGKELKVKMWLALSLDKD
ncbi:MAG: hypothetical protein JRE47_12870 [Deltaproteobacteria bacterium]|nr:hypothetical protein [Deltaproteobacteria bacterium]